MINTNKKYMYFDDLNEIKPFNNKYRAHGPCKGFNDPKTFVGLGVCVNGEMVGHWNFGERSAMLSPIYKFLLIRQVYYIP